MHRFSSVSMALAVNAKIGMVLPLRKFSDRPRRVETVHLGHVYVHQNRIELTVPKQFHRFNAIARERGTVAELPQNPFN